MTFPSTRVDFEVIQQAPRTLAVEDKEFVTTFKPADATPSVLNLTKFKAGNTVANNVTFFDDGFEGKEISILGDGFTTAVHDTSKLITNAGANKLLAANKVYRFTLYKISTNLVWVEDA